jgi:hypothetical protein
METLEVKITTGEMLDMVHLGRQKTFCNAGSLQAKLIKRGWRIVNRSMGEGSSPVETWRPRRSA